MGCAITVLKLSNVDKRNLLPVQATHIQDRNWYGMKTNIDAVLCCKLGGAG
jgi:hypothetical protein